MEKRTAKWIWISACTESINENVEKHTALGHMMIALGVPVPC